MPKNNFTVLVVEDEPFLQKILLDKLSREKIPTLHANNGEEALAIAFKEHPNIILLDILMPRKDGMETLADLRKDPWGAKVPVVMLTNLNDPDHINQAKALGAKDFIVKADWKLSEVVEKVRKYVAETS